MVEQMINSKNLVKYAKGTEIAQSGEFVLFKLKKSGEWQNYKLVHRTRRGSRAKRCWWFACNSHRLCRNHDLSVLGEHDPETYRWLEITLIKEGTET